MLSSALPKLKLPKNVFTQIRKCQSVFGIKHLIQQEKAENFTLSQVRPEQHGEALSVLKQHYLPAHVLVRARNMSLDDDQALDEYLVGLLKQGNSLMASSMEGCMAGVCVCFASCPVDPRNLRHYAFYRQDPNTKDFLYFSAKMQETPNLWEVFKEMKVFEIKMLTVLPEYRRQGLAVLLAEQSIELAYDQGYNVIRMDCINPHDYKIAERCMLECVAKFPLHQVRGAHAPFITSSSPHDVLARVYAAARVPPHDKHVTRLSQLNLTVD